MKASFITCSGEQNFQPFRNQPLGPMYLMTILEKEFGNNLDLSLIDLRGVKKENAIYHIPERDVYFYSLASIESLEDLADVTADLENVDLDDSEYASDFGSAPKITHFED